MKEATKELSKVKREIELIQGQVARSLFTKFSKDLLSLEANEENLMKLFAMGIAHGSILGERVSVELLEDRFAYFYNQIRQALNNNQAELKTLAKKDS